VNEAIEPQRAAGKLGKSLDAGIELSSSNDTPTFQALDKHRSFLPELFIVSHVGLGSAKGADFNVTVRPCNELGLVRCPRCWRWVPGLETTAHGDTCPRCAEALKP
jgi:isoleucyl-tRNA synthetase